MSAPNSTEATTVAGTKLASSIRTRSEYSDSEAVSGTIRSQIRAWQVGDYTRKGQQEGQRWSCH